MLRRPPRSTRTDTLFPYTTLFRSDVAHHVTEIVFGGDDLDLHDRLEQDRAGLVEAFLEAHRAGDLERHFRRVDLMVRTVDQLHLDVDDRIAGKEAVRDRFLDALVEIGRAHV